MRLGARLLGQPVENQRHDRLAFAGFNGSRDFTGLTRLTGFGVSGRWHGLRHRREQPEASQLMIFCGAVLEDLKVLGGEAAQGARRARTDGTTALAGSSTETLRAAVVGLSGWPPRHGGWRHERDDNDSNDRAFQHIGFHSTTVSAARRTWASTPEPTVTCSS